VKEGETTNDLFTFLTTEPNALVGTFHPKAMPVILTTQAEIDLWMTAPALEALTFGLPIVMNYSVMYEYAVDRSSTQFRAPFNEIDNEARVYTYQDTTITTPNSDTPYSMCWLDLRAEPMVLSVPVVERSRCHVVQLVDGST
jgi:hypothetical protein